jgi:hypothetical protein
LSGPNRPAQVTTAVTQRDGAMTRIELFRGLDDALEAVGLRE